MRARGRGIGPVDPDVPIEVAGRPVLAARTDSVASAMLAVGERLCRVDSAGEGRGVFCGMAVCHECTVLVDGEPALACMTKVGPGMSVDPHPPLASPAPAGTVPEELPERTLEPDVLVIGAGPAGLTAAELLLGIGLDVVVVDERRDLGGQYYKQPSAGFDLDEPHLDGQYRQGRALIARVRGAGGTILEGTTVWAAFAPDHLLARREHERLVLRPRRVVVAVGAYERGVPVPGWTLPGVMTTGAGQTLVRSYQVAPGSRVLVAGNGPLNIQLAAELTRAGAHVVGLAELAPVLRPGRARRGVTMARSAPGLMRDGTGYLATLARHRVPVLTGSGVVRLEGDPTDGVTRAVVARIDADGRPLAGTERGFDVDAVCLGYGFLPSTDLARSLGCRHDVDPVSGALVAQVDGTGRTSVPEVWVVGDAGGIRGAKVAAARGTLAGAGVAASLDVPVPAEATRAARRAEARHLRFQEALNAMFAAPVLVDQLAEDDTVVCRCERLTLAEVRAGASPSMVHAGSIKRATRVGMGKCQGRYCGPLVARLGATTSGTAVDERSGFAPQAPVKPVALSDVAASPLDG